MNSIQHGVMVDKIRNRRLDGKGMGNGGKALELVSLNSIQSSRKF